MITIILKANVPQRNNVERSVANEDPHSSIACKQLAFKMNGYLLKNITGIHSIILYHSIFLSG